ncbi:hypothetical protein [Hirschia litorea]|uniref:Copper resistance protein D domain-containing protein n=1 Tax=Hirschia litorea TaxID=1199156 RepID=A0ABW2IGZ3_9PROT
MPIEALFTLLHVLVFVYWLGGDLGAFYTSRFLIKPDISREQRLLALKVVNDVDMAPRSAIILALPTGLIVAQAKGWLAISPLLLTAVILVSLAWLILAWKLHLDHGKSPKLFKNLDMVLRHGALLGLIVFAIAGFMAKLDIPMFLSIKMLILAGCISLGLFIRKVLIPLGPAIGKLIQSNSENAQNQIADTLNRARPLVVGIWTLLLAAALMGLWMPTSF